MSKRSTFVKVGIVASSLLFGTVATAAKIALLPQNKAGISNELGQQDFKITAADEKLKDLYGTNYKSVKELMEAGKKLIREIEAEGAVLLKNNNALPLAQGEKINLVGSASYASALGGRGSAQQGAKSDPAITLLEGLKNAKNSKGESANLNVNESVLNLYSANSTDQWTNTIKEGIVANGGVAIYTIARTGGEGKDFTNGSNGSVDMLALSENEKATLKGLKELKDNGSITKIIVLLNNSNQIADFLSDPAYGIDAGLWIGNPGLTGMAAVGDIIGGAVNPSGHLSDMHWYNHTDNPVSKNFDAYRYQDVDNFPLPKGTDGKVLPKYATYDVYQEGMYLGYRYAETRYYDKVTNRPNTGEFDYSKVVAHPFGYGESYTDFAYSNFKLTDKGTTYEVTLDVTNTGNTYSGKDAVQLYVQKPYNQKAIERGIEVPAVELVGFAKTDLIAPGKKDSVTITVDKSKLAVYDAHTAKTYIQNDGKYFFTAAEDSHDAVNNILAAQGYKKADTIMTSDGNKELVGDVELTYSDTIFSKAKNGTQITNLFDQADINKFKGKGFNKVKYVSRNNWDETLPKSNVVLTMSRGISSALTNQDDPAKMIKQDETKYPTYGAQNNLLLKDLVKDENGNRIDYNDPKWDLFLDQLTWEQTVKLITNGLRQTPGLPELGKPGTTDHNGPAGLTQAYGESGLGLAAIKNDPDKEKRAPFYPCAGIIAATFSQDLFTKFGDMLGEDAIWAGYGGLYGIAINTHRSPYEGRAFEYFSEDPFLAGTAAALESKALQSHGCNAYIKHFALNEQENIRQGVQIWLNEQTLREVYLKPFEMAVVDGGANNAMASFTRIGVEFNPACKALMTDFLRGECGMKGLVVTDMYDIGYEPEHMPVFIQAGCDLPDGAVLPKLFDPYREGYGSFAQAMRESAKRVLYSTTCTHSIMYDTVSVIPTWIKLTYAAVAITGVLFIGAVATGVFFAIKDRKSLRKREEA